MIAIRNGNNEKEVTESVSLASIIAEECVVLLDCETKEEALIQMIDLLAATPFVRKRAELVQGIFAREELMSTALGYGIGVPHVRLDSVKGIVMAVGVCKEPIRDYISLDDDPVQIICMLVARKNQHAQYIRTLSAISSRLKSEDVRERILVANDPGKIFHLLVD